VDRVERQASVNRWVDEVRHIDKGNGVAVRSRARGDFRPHDAVHALLVVDIYRLSQHFSELRSQYAHDHVGRAAGGNWHDETDRPLRIVVVACTHGWPMTMFIKNDFCVKLKTERRANCMRLGILPAVSPQASIGSRSAGTGRFKDLAWRRKKAMSI